MSEIIGWMNEWMRLKSMCEWNTARMRTSLNKFMTLWIHELTHINPMNALVSEWLPDEMTNWLIDWLTDRMNEWNKTSSKGEQDESRNSCNKFCIPCSKISKTTSTYFAVQVVLLYGKYLYCRFISELKNLSIFLSSPLTANQGYQWCQLFNRDDFIPNQGQLGVPNQ